jgi:hypothetical protein
MMGALQEASTKVRELEQDKQLEFNKLLIEGYSAETDRITALGGAMTPEVVQQLVMQTLQQVMTSPDPTPVQQMPMPPMDDMPMGDMPMIPPEMAATGAHPGLA